MTFPLRPQAAGPIIQRWLKTDPIYVEILIRAPMHEVWRHTQTPDIHARWDLRFTAIEYLPKADPDDPQRFRYVTRLGPLSIAGEGVTAGSQERPESRTSALEFGTDDRKSLIGHGSGYWQYIQTEDGVRFLTRYSYDPRWGRIGRLIDRLLFRRMLGWATAWSFDRLRLWLEDDLDPAVALRLSAVHTTSRVALAAIWLYHGIVPKLLYQHPGEVEPLRGALISDRAAWRIVRVAGLGEVGAGIGTIALWNRREVFPVTGIVLLALAGGVLARQPATFRAPFNPASLTIAAVGLSVTGFLASRDLPTSRRCSRTQARRAS